MTERSPTIVHPLLILQMKQSIESEGDITLITFIYGRGVTVMHWLQESNCVDRKKCLTSETIKKPKST